jgi:AraC-like DNA-binding protein
LRKGDKKLFEVAKAVGYDSDAAFSKAFRRVVGVAPRAYGRSAALSFEATRQLASYREV